MDPCVEVGRFGLDGEVDRLRRDKHVLMMELVKLRQQQQNTRITLQAMEQRLQGTEIKQQQMMKFLARAMQNPGFIQQLVQQKEKRKKLEEAISKKRRRPIDQGPSRARAGGGESSNGSGCRNPIKIEPLDFIEGYGFEVSELEALALEMQGLGGRSSRKEEIDLPEGEDRELDEGFWEELLNERFGGVEGHEEEEDEEEEEEEEEEDVNVLVDRFGYLGSSPK